MPTDIDTIIVENIKVCIHILKACSTEEQRVQYGYLLQAVAPALVKRGDKEGLGTKIAARLELLFGVRFVKGTKISVKYAFTLAVGHRDVFNTAAEVAAQPKEDLKAGDAVLCRGQLATLAAYDPVTGHCSVNYSAEGTDISKLVNYKCRFGNSQGSARLQRPPALLLTARRQERKDAITQEVLVSSTSTRSTRRTVLHHRISETVCGDFLLHGAGKKCKQ